MYIFSGNCACRFKVKPEETEEEDSNFLYNYRMLGRRWGQEGSPERVPPAASRPEVQTRTKPGRSRPPRHQVSYEDKAALIAGTPTSQMSLSSSGGDSAEGTLDSAHTRANFMPYVKRDCLPHKKQLADIPADVIPSDGISYNDLMSESGYRDFSSMENGHTSLSTRGDHNSQETSFRGPLPILAPISSSHDPVFKPRGQGDLDKGKKNTIETTAVRPNSLEPLRIENPLFEHRKRQRRSRSKHPSPNHNHVAMETISHDPAESVPIKNGESNA